MSDICIKMVMTVFSTAGFALVAQCRFRRLPFVALGGVIAYGLYLIMGALVDGEFVPNLVAALGVTVYSSLCAKGLKAPTQVFLLPPLIPLVPGALLYRAMFHVINGLYQEAGHEAWQTLVIGVGLAGGMTVGLTFASVLHSLWGLRRTKSTGA